MEVVHQRLSSIKGAHSSRDRLVKHQLRFIWIATRFSSDMVHCLMLGFTENFNAFLRVWTNFTSTRFLIFPICFPKTELLINLKNSSQIHSLLLRAASCWAQCISSAKALLWSLFPDEPFWSSNLGLNIVWGSYDEWHTSPYHSGASGLSLCKSLGSFGYLRSTSKMQGISRQLSKLVIHVKPLTGWG